MEFMNAIFTDLYDFGNSSDDFALSSYDKGL